MQRRMIIWLGMMLMLFLSTSVMPPISALGSTSSTKTMKVATLTKTASAAFVQDLRRRSERYVAAQARSARRLRARGFTPTDQVVVQKVTGRKIDGPRSVLSQLLRKASPGLLARQEYDFDGGYVIYGSWTDGDDSTWEGNVYVYDDEDDLIGSFDVQLDISGTAGSGTTDPPVVDFAGGDLDDPKSGNGPQEISFEVIRGLFAGMAHRSSGTGALRARTGCACGLMQEGGGAMANCMIKGALDNAWPSCAVSAGGCVFTGPAWPECFAVSCGIAIGAYFIKEMQDVQGRCSVAPSRSPIPPAHTRGALGEPYGKMSVIANRGGLCQVGIHT